MNRDWTRARARAWHALLIASLAVIVSPAFQGAASAQTPPTPTPGEAVFSQEEALRELRQRIAGHEKAPAEEVFRNVQIFRGAPAARLLAIMEIGYARSLGVTCTHCHVAGAWEKDDRPEKRIAREMSKMVKTINGELLGKIPDLKSETPTVNCTTCHRGEIKPALNLPQKAEASAE